jgi:hypothetical protein
MTMTQEQISRPVALGFTDGMTAIEELYQRVHAGHHDYAIMLAGGLALSRKTIHYAATSGPGAPGIWHITNEIDGTTQMLTDEGLWSQSNIGEALDKRALLDMSGDPMLVIEGRGPVLGSTLTEEAAKVEPVNDDPLRYEIGGGPGAIRMSAGEEADWEPADSILTLEVMDIGPATVAQIDLAATSHGFADGTTPSATTSIELTIEDIDGLIATLNAIKWDAIENRGFAPRAKDGLWTNGIEEDFE